MLRDCLSGEILLAKSLLSSTAKDLAGLIAEVRRALPVPITGVISDGQESIRKAVARTLRGAPSSLPFPLPPRGGQADLGGRSPRQEGVEEAGPGIRPIERGGAGGGSGKDDNEAEIVRGYCAGVRTALTDDGLPPLTAAGLKLHDRLSRIAASLDHVAARRAICPGG